MRPIWLGTKPPLNQSAPSPPWAMLPPSSEGVTPDAAAEYEVRTGSVGPGVGAGAGPGGGGGGGGAGGAGCGEFDESITLLPEKTVWSAPPPHAVRLAARAATSWRRNDTSMAAMLARGRRRERRCCKRVRVTQPFEHRPREPSRSSPCARWRPPMPARRAESGDRRSVRSELVLRRAPGQRLKLPGYKKEGP